MEQMARIDLRNVRNTDGDWFVDTRCIDCGTCRDIAPDLFGSAAGSSVVVLQPDLSGPSETSAWLAAQACPTSSIGTQSRRARPGRLCPHEIEPASGVFDCGYCSEDSFGASAWFARRASGNIMVDSPRYTDALVGPLVAAGGIDHILLTHRDDVADAGRWAERFAARVWIHADDAAAAPFATDVISGPDDVTICSGVIAVPTPGHTRGSMMFLVDDEFLFTGDSLAWSHERHDLTAFRDACWWSWPAQAESLARLAQRHRFSWVLPGHGARVHDRAEELHRLLDALVERMRSAPAAAPA